MFKVRESSIDLFIKIFFRLLYLILSAFCLYGFYGFYSATKGVYMSEYHYMPWILFFINPFILVLCQFLDILLYEFFPSYSLLPEKTLMIIGWIVVSIVILSGYYYWFKIIPYINKICQKWTDKKV